MRYTPYIKGTHQENILAFTQSIPPKFYPTNRMYLRFELLRIDMSSTNFSINLKALIKSRGLRLKAISEKASIPLSTLSEWTDGRDPKLSKALLRLCECLGVTLDELTREPLVGTRVEAIEATAFIKLSGEDYKVLIKRIKKAGAK